MLIDRWGTRRLALPGLVMMILVFSGFALASGSWIQWLVMWAIYALVSLSIKSTVWTAAIVSVFNAGRGMAIGIVLSGTAITQVITPPLGNWLITEFGWRLSFVLIATIWGGIAFLACLFFFYDGHDKLREERKQAVANSLPPPTLPGLTAAEALRCVALWRIGLSTFIMMVVTIALVVHQFPILVEAGISREKAALFASLGGVAGIIGKMVTGTLLDRLRQPNWVCGITLAAASIAFLLLMKAFRTPALIVVAVVINGYASGTKLQICGYLTPRYSGLKNFGLIFSFMASAIALGSAIGPVLGGYFYDVFGDYDYFLLIGVVGCLVSGYLIFSLGAYPNWETTIQRPSEGAATAG